MPSRICLDSLDSLPADLSNRLKNYRAAFQKTPCLEEVLRDANIGEIANELESHLKQQRILGYHCTREPFAGFYQELGLRLTNVRHHQTEFLDSFCNWFSPKEITQIEEAWLKYFDKEEKRNDRENQIWACLTRPNPPHDGTENLFQYFGGEVIFMPLMKMLVILDKLTKIGCPVIVEIELPANELHINGPVSHALLSCYHRTIRPDVYLSESEACFWQSVPLSKIIQVTTLNKFQS